MSKFVSDVVRCVSEHLSAEEKVEGQDTAATIIVAAQPCARADHAGRATNPQVVFGLEKD